MITIEQTDKGGADTEKRERMALMLLSATHFLVDFCCTALLTALAARLTDRRDLVAFAALLYNGLAFAFQLPIGALADALRLSRVLTAFGCLLVAFGSLFSAPVWLCLLIGLGNACFHVGGGREALLRSGVRAAPVGCFVAPGALGIFFGPLCGDSFVLSRVAAPLLLAFCGLLLLHGRSEGAAENAHPAPLALSRKKFVGVLFCMFFTVLLRSYLGASLRYPFQDMRLVVGIFTLFLAGGKALGGLLGDRFGAFRFSLIAQPLCVLLLLLSLQWQWLAMPAVLLFHTTMALTASTLFRCAPAQGGTMFGLTTIALFLGALPRLLLLPPLPMTTLGLGLAGVLSAAFLLLGLYWAKENTPC